MSNVKLAVRVRPFTERELRSEKDRTPVVTVVDDNTITITNVKVNVSGAGDSRERVRSYHADYTFDSAVCVTHPNYASQEKIFNTIGQEAIKSVSQGCSTCVLAYGQSATGKTHTMMGTETDPGLIPRLCRALATIQPLELTVSFLEIYNERVHDLLAGDNLPCHSLPRRRGNARKDLRVREHPDKGPYVQNLRRVAINDIDALLLLVNEGARRRQTASTRRNPTSSRSHALLEIATPTATLHLADLAGRSESDYKNRSAAAACFDSESESSSDPEEYPRPPKKTNKASKAKVVKKEKSSKKSGTDSSRRKRHNVADLGAESESESSSGEEDLRSSKKAKVCNSKAKGTKKEKPRNKSGEKAGWEGCGGRQKEGANINKSLVALSNVISALVNCGSVRGRGRRFVPYRDSALTWLLKECFTGGACSFIIATVSPSVACYSESASTLRWAARARQLPTRRQSVASGARQAVHAHYTRLLAELSRNFIHYVPETGKIAYDDNHWKLNTYTVNQELPDVSDKPANIGNIMNLFHPKTDASESTPSSAASGSSDVINTMDKNIKIDITSEISKEVNKLFGPALERTQSNSDLKVIAPLRHKRRQYKSQEILPIVETLQKDTRETNVLSVQREDHIKTNKKIDNIKSSEIPILYDNQRAEIVASVTERLYNKIKKKEEAAASKVEAVIDKKIMEPLSELRICTNARQRLMEIGQKALRNKRRIGIPAHTQTKKSVTRVKDQGIDVQTDLEAYVFKNNLSYTLRRDAATETVPMTPRCKEIAVGSKYGMLYFNDKTTLTEEKKVSHKSSLMMTDVVIKCDRTTQTQIVPPPRRKRRITCCKCAQHAERKVTEENTAPVISINISQVYSLDSESQTSADESDNTVDNNDKSESINMTPDLLANHSSNDLNVNNNAELEETSESNNNTTPIEKDVTVSEIQKPSKIPINLSEDFSDTEECALPRVTVDSSEIKVPEKIQDIILGRNENVYPYNIVLSPPRVVDYTKRIVKFKEEDVIPGTSVASQTAWDWQNKNGTSIDPTENVEPINSSHSKIQIQYNQETHPNSYSDSTESSQVDTDSFIWEKGNATGYCDSMNKTNTLGRSYTPIYRGPKYAKAKAKLYREFLGLDKEDHYEHNSQTASKNSSRDISSSDSGKPREVSNHSFRRRKTILEEKLKFKCHPKNSFRSVEDEIMKSCNSLEASVNRYENYLSSYLKDSTRNLTGSTGRTPTEYLQHLVQLRRQVVKGDCDTDSSLGYIQK